MTAFKPKGLLSFVYNATGVPAYRTEMHLSMTEGFKRFAVTDPLDHAACFAVERAAYERRVIAKGHVDGELPRPLRQGGGASRTRNQSLATNRAELTKAAEDLFDRVGKQLILGAEPHGFQDLRSEIDPGAPAGTRAVGFGPVRLTEKDVVEAVPDFGLLLGYVYYIVHFPDTRPSILNAFAGHPLRCLLVELVDELNKNNSLPKMPDALQTSLAEEYACRGWIVCW